MGVLVDVFVGVLVGVLVGGGCGTTHPLLRIVWSPCAGITTPSIVKLAHISST